MDSLNCKQYVWRLGDLFSSSYSYGLLLLNNSVTFETSDFLRKLWFNARVRVCVDGGTNNYHRIMQGCGANKRQCCNPDRHEDCPQSTPKCQANGNSVHKASIRTDMMKKKQSNSVAYASVSSENSLPFSNCNGSHELNETTMSLGSSTNGFHQIYSGVCKETSVSLPHFISGDFDSIEPNILQHYTDLGVEIVPTPAQDESDFTKALKQLDVYLLKQSQRVHHVLAAVSISHDRFDHVLANINTLHKSALSVPVLLVSPSSVMFLLRPGRHELVIPVYSAPHHNWCGYAPCAGPATVTTSGLKWDVCNTLVQFGGLVSTSNEFAEGCSSAFITTDQPLLFMFNRPLDDAPEGLQNTGTAAPAARQNGGAVAVVDPLSDTS